MGRGSFRLVHCQNVECSVLLTQGVPQRVTAVMHRIESAYAQLVNMRSKSNHSLRTSSQKCNNLDGPAGNRQYDYLLASCAQCAVATVNMPVAGNRQYEIFAVTSKGTAATIYPRS